MSYRIPEPRKNIWEYNWEKEASKDIDQETKKRFRAELMGKWEPKDEKGL